MDGNTYRQPTLPTPVVGSAASETTAVFTAEQQPASQPAKVIGRPFQKGQSGNPKGRPKGSRNRLTDNVLRMIAKDFATHGTEVLERIRNEEPAVYLKLVISLLPRELIMQFEMHRPGEVAQLSHEEILELAECDQNQRFAEQAYRNIPPSVSGR